VDLEFLYLIVGLPAKTRLAAWVESEPPKRGGRMGRKPRVDRTPEEKWQIVQEGVKSGNVSPDVS
jgi:hypothetical protein